MNAPARAAVTLTVLAAALGYFVDVYDLIVFSTVRVQSLVHIGVPQSELLSTGVYLLNMQMGGALIGGVLFGTLGDKRGRLSVLFGSITLYSLANLANAFVDTVAAYAVWRFIAGVGLAGELGAGVTLVSEIISAKGRGYGSAIIAGVGFLGAILAVLVGTALDWRAAYFVGGAMGFLVLALRIGVRESALFEQVKARAIDRGNFLRLFRGSTGLKYLLVVAAGLPIWYVMGILMTFAPEFGREMGLKPAPSAALAVLYTHVGLAPGGLCSGFVSQWLHDRKRVIATLFVAQAAFVVLYFTVGGRSTAAFYATCVLLGVTNGYWAVYVVMAAEQFGTNLRATATTTAPNFVRGALVPMTWLFQSLQGYATLSTSALIVGGVVLATSLVALGRLAETCGRSLDFVE